MKISERSWHLRFVRWVNDDGAMFKRWFNPTPNDEFNAPYQPHDLCRYFWAFVASIGMLLILIGIGGVTFLICQTVYWTWRVLSWVVWHALVSPAVSVWDAIPKRHRREPKGPPNLVVAFIRAKKRRVCPLIEVTKESTTAD
jgi:hypothetical protein